MYALNQRGCCVKWHPVVKFFTPVTSWVGLMGNQFEMMSWFIWKMNSHNSEFCSFSVNFCPTLTTTQQFPWRGETIHVTRVLTTFTPDGTDWGDTKWRLHLVQLQVILLPNRDSFFDKLTLLLMKLDWILEMLCSKQTARHSVHLSKQKYREEITWLPKWSLITFGDVLRGFSNSHNAYKRTQSLWTLWVFERRGFAFVIAVASLIDDQKECGLGRISLRWDTHIHIQTLWTSKHIHTSTCYVHTQTKMNRWVGR